MGEHRPGAIRLREQQRRSDLPPLGRRRPLLLRELRQHAFAILRANSPLHGTVRQQLQAQHEVLSDALLARRYVDVLCHCTLSNQLGYKPRGLSLKPRTRGATSRRPTM